MPALLAMPLQLNCYEGQTEGLQRKRKEARGSMLGSEGGKERKGKIRLFSVIQESGRGPGALQLWSQSSAALGAGTVGEKYNVSLKHQLLLLSL